MATTAAWGGITLDYCDTPRAAEFWSQLLEVPARPQSLPGWYELGPMITGGPVINLQPVPERKQGKTRLHLDLWVADVVDVVSLVVRLGGEHLESHTHEEWLIAVMADPEKVEFCLVGPQL